MSELPPAATNERKLWFDGPNYTADAIAVDPDAAKILLIQRGDTGEWALPGGFVDPNDASTKDAAFREVAEESHLVLDGHAPLVFRGIVDDPRNSQDAWIETSAHLITTNHDQDVSGGDDARDARWHDIADLPPLYASHQAIIERGLDYLDGMKLFDAASSPDTSTPVNGGHMEYDKFIFGDDDQPVFAKQHSAARFSDDGKYQRGYLYLEKEAFTMAHLRQHGFTGLPRRSALHDTTLAMDALRPKNGWQWRANPEDIDAYIHSALDTFSDLETMPVPADSFAIDPSYESFTVEGWYALDSAALQTLHQQAESFAGRLSSETRASAAQLLTDLPNLRRAGMQPHQPDGFVFCHHDIRQANLAWHPDHGTKLVDWSWAGMGEPGSDATGLLIDLHKAGHDISDYRQHLNPRHCLTLMGFWLGHSTWPHRGDDTVRFQQFLSAVSAYEILKTL